MFDLEFENKLIEILNKYDENWLKEPLDSDFNRTFKKSIKFN